MVETKTIDQEIEELETQIEERKARKKLKVATERLKKLESEKEKPAEESKKQPEPEVKERLTFEVLRVLKTKYNWKFVAGALFAWFILWLFNH